MALDTLVVSENWQEQRQLFIDLALRVTKPGGCILIACPNRLFPVDFYHGGKSYAGIHMRFHSPQERFLPSYGDIQSLFNNHVDEVKALPLKNFFNLKNEENKGLIKRTIFAMVDAVLGLMPDFYWKTPFAPYVVVLAKKKSR